MKKIKDQPKIHILFSIDTIKLPKALPNYNIRCKAVG